MTKTLLLVLAGVCGLTSTAFAQAIDTVGSRALGMGGAFVAVADDATGVHWNPAALALGQPAGGAVEWNQFRSGDPDASPVSGAWRRSSRLMSFGTWPVGVSYTRVDESALVSGTVSQRLLTRSYGLSLLQSLSNTFIVGGTFRYMRGTVAEQAVTASTVGEALDAVADDAGETSGEFDMDLSAVFNGGPFRVGAVVRHLTTPEFAGRTGAVRTLQRRSRVGLAVLPTAGLTLAMDLDVDTVDEPTGPRRMLAAGAEHRLSPKVMARAGARRNLAGDKAWVATAGLSVALRPGTWLDGHAALGRSDGERGFGLAVRAGW